MSQSAKVSKNFGAVTTSNGQYETKRGTTLGALSTVIGVTNIQTTGAATATLAAGKEGKEKTLVMTVDGGDCVVTVTNLQGGTTITLNDVGDVVRLLYMNAKWNVVSNLTATIA